MKLRSNRILRAKIILRLSGQTGSHHFVHLLRVISFHHHFHCLLLSVMGAECGCFCGRVLALVVETGTAYKTGGLLSTNEFLSYRAMLLTVLYKRYTTRHTSVQSDTLRHFVEFVTRVSCGLLLLHSHCLRQQQSKSILQALATVVL